MEATDLKFLNALNSIPGVGSATLRTLKNHFGTYEAAWRATEQELAQTGITAKALQSILWKRPSLHPDRELQKLAKENIWTLTEDDENYPSYIKEITNPPVILYGKGAMLDERISIGVVGTRRPTAYGIEATQTIVRELAQAGLTIVSGLASGIDARAHDTTVEAGGKTIAVLGSGLDHYSIFPPENRGLARRIVEGGGTLLCEYAPGTPAVKEHFPARNRIISGLSRGVLVIEAREKSGARITTRMAMEQNRDVFALPGSIFSPTSRWPLMLIQQGAKLVTSAQDILEELGIEYNKDSAQKLNEIFGENEKTLLDILEAPLGVDALKEKTGLATGAIMATLSMLELKGSIRNLGGDTYQKIS
ncbi:MAG: DNA-protecting protein DprA [Candidatus Sungbacteria bacterium]|nr:DNA-protecting protein DprA [Candidatus Sungbacteria bacterium]